MFSAQKNASSVAASPKLYVEDVFSTHLYTGNNTARSITNGIDLAANGGMVWIKSRTYSDPHALFDTVRGTNKYLSSNSSAAQTVGYTDLLTGFASTGFNLGVDASTIALVNGTGYNFTSWTFRKSPKFFDIVTYVGNGVTSQTINHSLDATVGCIIVKRTDGVGNWTVYFRSGTGNTSAVFLNTTGQRTISAVYWNNTSPTTTQFTVGINSGVNDAGVTYIAYLFAHDTASNGIIQNGSYTGNSPNPVVTLGWEPQFVMIKRVSGGAGNWVIMDNMRGMPVGYADATISPNLNSSEGSNEYITPTPTGFQINGFSVDINNPGSLYAYIAIRRPMKTPTVGTSVFAPVIASGTAPTYVTNFVTDMSINRAPSAASNNDTASRLTGTGNMATESTAAEVTNTANVWSYMNGWSSGSRTSYISWNFKRAPGFFDEVCYTGTGVTRTINHNLGIVPELMIVKDRSLTGGWQVYSANIANTEYLVLNATAAKATGATRWNSTTPSSTTFTVGTDASVNASGDTYVAYLFASCPGVSNVGTYTGNGSSQTINCGFAAGARFVLIKRTDSTGDWYVWDTTRGIVAGNDPHLSLNSTAAEVTTDDTIDTDSTGFIVNQVAATNVNVSSATYIYLAIA